MADPLVFLMGKYEAVLPTDRLYARNHMWAQPHDAGWRFGFSSYAIRLMKDVYFLEWSVNVGDALAVKQPIGHIETSKAVSDLFTPVAGTLACFNDLLLNDPSAINVDCHGPGWLFDLRDVAEDGLMDAAGYHAFLAAGWENTQRILKGQV
jgi:glycine cleavage system H protein